MDVDSLKVPALHEKQKDAPDAFEKVPVPQAAHGLPLAENLEAVQLTQVLMAAPVPAAHVVQAVEPRGETWLVSQSVQEDRLSALLNLPVAQSVQDVVPAVAEFQNLPATQFAQDVDGDVMRYIPRPHAVHAEAPAAEYKPVPQLVHAVVPGKSVPQKVLAGQLKQEVAPLYFPAPQEVQLPAGAAVSNKVLMGGKAAQEMHPTSLTPLKGSVMTLL